MSRLRPEVGPGDHISGPRQAQTLLLEYGDYECPACGAAFPELKRLQEELSGNSFQFVFRHFPLTQIHPHALIAAEAAEAASAQGRFWEMHDMLFENQDALDREFLIQYADELGLDLNRFSQDLDMHRHIPKIRQHFRSGVMSGVNGTPTLYINGFRHDGPWDAETLLAAMQGRTRIEAGEWSP